MSINLNKTSVAKKVGAFGTATFAALALSDSLEVPNPIDHNVDSKAIMAEGMRSQVKPVIAPGMFMEDYHQAVKANGSKAFNNAEKGSKKTIITPTAEEMAQLDIDSEEAIKNIESVMSLLESELLKEPNPERLQEALDEMDKMSAPERQEEIIKGQLDALSDPVFLGMLALMLLAIGQIKNRERLASIMKVGSSSAVLAALSGCDGVIANSSPLDNWSSVFSLAGTSGVLFYAYWLYTTYFKPTNADLKSGAKDVFVAGSTLLTASVIVSMLHYLGSNPQYMAWITSLTGLAGLGHMEYEQVRMGRDPMLLQNRIQQRNSASNPSPTAQPPIPPRPTPNAQQHHFSQRPIASQATSQPISQSQGRVARQGDDDDGWGGLV
mgnify:CR=1 FL=1